MPLIEIEQPRADTDMPKPGAQLAFSRDWKHRFIAAEGGWGSGKTWVGARKLLTLHIINSCNDDGEPTYCPSVILGPTYRNLYDVAIPMLEEACEDGNMSFAVRHEVEAVGDNDSLGGSAGAYHGLGGRCVLG